MEGMKIVRDDVCFRSLIAVHYQFWEKAYYFEDHHDKYGEVEEVEYKVQD